MGRLFFARDHADLDFPEAGVFQPAVQVAFRKAEPAVAVGFVRLLKAVLEQIKNQDLAARARSSRCAEAMAAAGFSA